MKLLIKTSESFVVMCFLRKKCFVFIGFDAKFLSMTLHVDC